MNLNSVSCIALDFERDVEGRCADVGSEEDELVSGAAFDPSGNWTFAAREILGTDAGAASSLPVMYLDNGS